MSHKPKTWTTDLECQFLDGLGRHGERMKDKASLLQGYLCGLAKRKIFTGDDLALSKATIEKYAKNLLKEAEK